MKTIHLLLMLVSLLFSAVLSAEEEGQPYLYILGVVQDAGYPQTGCYEPHCMPGWKDPLKRRGAVSLGLVDPADRKKYLFEATPNLPAQMYDLEVEAPSEEFALSGIFLTHAHIGHYAGLMFLGHESMGALGVPVFAMPRMSRFLEQNGPWSQLVDYNNIVLKPLQDNRQESLGTLKITPFLVPHRDEFSETVGFRIEGPNKTAIFIPDINKWEQWDTDIAGLVQNVDYALLDAAFYADGELPGRDMSRIPHPFVSESMEIFQELSEDQRNKVWFIHMNHTNPLLNPNSPEFRHVRSEGFNVAIEGLRLGL